jgi:hypothetical protein
MTYQCPVCGYDRLRKAPWTETGPSDEICPSCGIHFGYDDAAGGKIEDRQLIYERWRARWIQGGMKWFSSGQPPPRNWDPVELLSRVQPS